MPQKDFFYSKAKIKSLFFVLNLRLKDLVHKLDCFIFIHQSYSKAKQRKEGVGTDLKSSKLE